MLLIKNIEILDVPDTSKEMLQQDLYRTTIDTKPITRYYIEDKQGRTIIIGTIPETEKKIGFIFRQLGKISEEKINIRFKFFQEVYKNLELDAELKNLRSRNFLGRLRFLLLKK